MNDWRGVKTPERVELKDDINLNEVLFTLNKNLSTNRTLDGRIVPEERSILSWRKRDEETKETKTTEVVIKRTINPRIRYKIERDLSIERNKDGIESKLMFRIQIPMMETDERGIVETIKGTLDPKNESDEMDDIDNTIAKIRIEYRKVNQIATTVKIERAIPVDDETINSKIKSLDTNPDVKNNPQRHRQVIISCIKTRGETIPEEGWYPR